MRHLPYAAVVTVMAAIVFTEPARAQLAPNQGGTLPLSEVLDIAKPYPNLTTQVRLRLIASNTTRETITCTGQRLSNTWTALSGARIAPYVCAIGKRTLTVTAEQIYYDKAGYKLKPTDPALATKAAKVVESRLKWSWK
jgi:hypothetical protein